MVKTIPTFCHFFRYFAAGYSVYCGLRIAYIIKIFYFGCYLVNINIGKESATAKLIVR